MCYGKHHCKAGEEAWECTYCIGTGEDIGDKRKRGENGGEMVRMTRKKEMAMGVVISRERRRRRRVGAMEGV